MWPFFVAVVVSLQPMKRKVNHIVIHCTATQPEAKIESIKRYWREKKGWKSPGYHFIIEANGDSTQLQAVSLQTNGVKGHNHDSVHISYIGGINKAGKPKDTRTPEQIASMIALIKMLKEIYPDADVLGHRDFQGVKKACPSFDVKSWLKTIEL